MAGIFKTLAGLLEYKEPKNEELGFELLEDQNEGNEDRYDSETGDAEKDGENAAEAQDKSLNQGKKQKSGEAGCKKPATSRKKCSEGVKDKAECNDGELSQLTQPLTVEEWNGHKKKERSDSSSQAEKSEDMSAELRVNLEAIMQKFNMPKNQDIIIREFKVGRKIKAFIAYVEGMIDKQTINLAILPKLMDKDILEELGEEYPVDFLIENVLTVHSVRKANKYSNAVRQILTGASALFVEGCRECILIDTRGYEKRNVDKPITETVVKGPQEGFSENLRTNVTLVRRIIRNENLITEILPVGNTNHLTCAVMYMQGIANPKVIQEVKKRIKKINADFVVGDGMVEQFIEDDSLMLFPQMLSTERPDRTASFIMEGQVAIIVEGTPFALAVPITFFRLFHTSEDSFVRWPASNFLRIIRLFGLFCATLLPGFYVAVVLYHPEMIPTELLSSIATARETVPFPTILEVLLMEVSFELIREGGIRVPSVIGQTLGIVGALILGQAAVAAGLVSPLLVIVVSITGLGSFAIPNYTLGLAIRIERFLFIFAGAVLGFYGISLLVFLLACLACSMKSFGVPFFSPVAPRTKVNPDIVTRGPIWAQKNRPDPINTSDRKSQGENVKIWAMEEDQNEGRRKNK